MRVEYPLKGYGILVMDSHFIIAFIYLIHYLYNSFFNYGCNLYFNSSLNYKTVLYILIHPLITVLYNITVPSYMMLKQIARTTFSNPRYLFKDVIVFVTPI